MGCRTIPHPPHVFTMIPVDTGHTWATWGSNVSNPPAMPQRSATMHQTALVTSSTCILNLDLLRCSAGASEFGDGDFGHRKRSLPTKNQGKAWKKNLKTRPVPKTTSELWAQPLIFDEATGPPGWGSNLLWDVCEVQIEVSPRGQCWRWCGGGWGVGTNGCLVLSNAFNFHHCSSMFMYLNQCYCLPSGKHTKNYGKPPFSMGKSSISMVIFNSYVTNYQRVITRDSDRGWRPSWPCSTRDSSPTFRWKFAADHWWLSIKNPVMMGVYQCISIYSNVNPGLINP